MDEKYLVLVREVATDKAKISLFGETRKRLGKSAACANENVGLKENVAWNSEQDLLKLLKEVQYNR